MGGSNAQKGSLVYVYERVDWLPRELSSQAGEFEGMMVAFLFSLVYSLAVSSDVSLGVGSGWS